MTCAASAIRRYFLTGLLAIIPIWGTYLVLKTLLETLDGFVGNTLRQHLPYYIPGLGIIVLLLLIFTVGLLTANFWGSGWSRGARRSWNIFPLCEASTPRSSPWSAWFLQARKVFGVWY